MTSAWPVDSSGSGSSAISSSSGDCSAGLAGGAAGPRPEPLPGGLGLGHGDQPARLAQPERRHVPVDRLVLARPDQVGLVPDAGAGARTHALPVIAPRGRVRVAGVVGERLEVI